MSNSTVWTASLWKDTFSELLEDEEQLDYGDTWNINFNYTPPGKLTGEERKRGWKEYTHCAFGNFQCGNCQKTWPSARVVMMFRYRLRSDRGAVIMYPFGQACRRCRDEFELPGFSQEEVEEALLRLFSKIRKNCYNDEDEDEYEYESGSSTGSTKVTKPHEKTLCQACRMGIYCQDDK